MTSRHIIAFLILVAAVLGAWTAWEQRQKADITLELNSARSELEALRAAQSRDALSPETRESALETLKAASADRTPLVTPPEPEPTPAPGAMREIFSDPAMQEAMMAQMHSGMEMLYRDLFDLLDLDQDTRDRLLDLVVRKHTSGMEMSFALMGGQKLTREERDAYNEKIQATLAETNTELEALLGHDAFQTLQRYERSQPEREKLKTVATQLRSAGHPLTEEAEASLMDAMYEERINFKYDIDFADTENLDLSNFTRQGIETYLTQQEQVRENILARASGILTPEQYELFGKALEQQAAMEKLNMDMGLKMFEGGGF